MANVALFVVSVFSLFTHLVALYSAQEVRNYTRCSPSPYSCNGVVGIIWFPFKNKTQPPECGLYTVDCSKGSGTKIQLKEGGHWHNFDFDGIDLGSVSINDRYLQDRARRQKDICSDEVFDMLSLPSYSPIIQSSTHNLTLFKCNVNTTLDKACYTEQCKNANHTYFITSNTDNGLFISTKPPQCTVIQLPLLLPPVGQPPYDISKLTAEFTLEVQVIPGCYKCINRNGTCQDYEGSFKCLEPGKKKWKLWLGRGVGIGGISLLIACSFLCLSFWVKKNKHHRTDEAFLKNYGPLQVKRYSYLDVKKMTNSFQKKLGQGGYGGVYKGKLNDGRLVAVKVLNRSKGNGEEFMNEVAAISRTSHVNIVILLGFCFEGSKRALIYEFMPNGSLEKYIFDTNNTQKDHPLGWEALHQISLGIARGLEYLHRGCNTRILHFDIKPHNILLDENFLPKISDFGLAKICDRKESIVSMLCARGTAGYIAPEVFCRNFGGVSHKSDVYSYGMMLSEMAGGRRNINVDAENTSEIYFPHWIYKRLELDEELGLHGIMNREDKVRARKMIIISLWCIQTDPSNRPAMKEVIEMFEGSVDSMQIPPKPYLSSPAKSPPESADNSATLETS